MRNERASTARINGQNRAWTWAPCAGIQLRKQTYRADRTKNTVCRLTALLAFVVSH